MLPSFLLYHEENVCYNIRALNSKSAWACSYAAGPMILALYLETMNVEGTRKDMKKTVTETLPLESVDSSNGDKTRVTFM